MYISNSFSPDELRKSGILKSEVLGSTILPSIICDQCITLYICDSLCVEALVTASVFVPPVHVLGNVNYLGLNDWGRRGSGGLSNGGGSGNNKLFLSRRGSNRGGLLLLGLGARRLRGAADFDLAVRGSLRRRRCGCGLIILSVRSVTTAKIEVQVLARTAVLGLGVVPVDVGNLGGLLSVVHTEDGAVLVVDCRFKDALLVSGLEVETIRTARAVLQVAEAVNKRHIKVIAIVLGLVLRIVQVLNLVLQLSDVLLSTGLRLRDLDRDTAVGSWPVPLPVGLSGAQLRGSIRRAALFFVDRPNVNVVGASIDNLGRSPARVGYESTSRRSRGERRGSDSVTHFKITLVEV